ncbi:mitotic spindle assembly checkpoint protein MAD2B-like isoform X1 [Asterias rubens]|uniref:mitotic spindle assembly checkpoint protein MAD2B-like isoform X1 n=1 Tax=Asterias rubens TaxID=7604 RepID=UPI001455BEE8|nr:mitotic spindle assembly checkpoint protein MAD2B-like isoform X1 [Asterias rubens]
MATEQGNYGNGIKLSQVAADILCEFLEVAVNQILYIRNLYPSGIFDRRKKYNVPVQMSRHPELNQYITDVIAGIKPLLVKDEIQCISVVIIHALQHPVERFVFEIAPPSSRSLSNDSFLINIEQSLRAFLLRINTCDAALQSNPPDCSFKILVHTKSSAVFSMEDSQFIQDFPWIEADEHLSALKDSSMTPLKMMSSDLIKMQLYVEESATKSSIEDHL